MCTAHGVQHCSDLIACFFLAEQTNLWLNVVMITFETIICRMLYPENKKSMNLNPFFYVIAVLQTQTRLSKKIVWKVINKVLKKLSIKKNLITVV